MVDAAAKREPLQAIFCRQVGDEHITPSPVYVLRGDDCELFTPEQLRQSADPDWRRARPTPTLEEYLSQRRVR
jgi:hypothetical protein